MKLALCPMATLSHEALRVLIHRWGDPDEYFSEMIHAPAFLAGGRFEQWYVRTAPCPERMVWQLTGNSAEPMIKAAEMLIPYGGIGIDLNMGCSAPDIAKTGAGIAWMSKPLSEVANLVRGVRGVLDRKADYVAAPANSVASERIRASESSTAGSNSRFRLSVKLRLGEEENYEKLIAFCRMLVDEGAELLTLHPRVRRGTYSRPAKREIVARLASDISVPVYGNGDVSSPEDALDFITRYPCAGLMIGRSAVQKPWIFGGIRMLEESRLEQERLGEARSAVAQAAGARSAGAQAAGARSAGAQAAGAQAVGAQAAGAQAAGAQAADDLQPNDKQSGDLRSCDCQQANAQPSADRQPSDSYPSTRSSFPESIDHLEVARSFLEHLPICQPPEFQLTRAHRFFFYYCNNFSFAHHIKMKIQNAKTVDAMLPLLEEYFLTMPDDQYLLK